MQRIGVVVVAFLTLVCYLAAFAGEESILDKVKKAGVVRIGSGTTTPPLNYLDEKGNWTGFDLDLGDAIAAKLGVKVERVNVNNKTRVAFLASGRIDLTVSSMGHTRSRDEEIDYAEPPYLWTGKMFHAKKGRFKSIADLGGKKNLCFPRLQRLYGRAARGCKAH
jgi:polar amino acid transport system substrate-binding protein